MRSPETRLQKKNLFFQYLDLLLVWYYMFLNCISFAATSEIQGPPQRESGERRRRSHREQPVEKTHGHGEKRRTKRSRS